MCVCVRNLYFGVGGCNSGGRRCVCMMYVLKWPVNRFVVACVCMHVHFYIFPLSQFQEGSYDSQLSGAHKIGGIGEIWKCIF